MRPILAGLAVLLALASPCLAGGSLSVRLVEASDAGTGVDAGLGDVAAALQNSMGLVFKGFSLVGTARMGLPADGTDRQLGPYQVRCSGPQSGLAIELRQGRKELLRTSVNLRDGNPLIVGGFQTRKGKMILVFLAQ